MTNDHPSFRVFEGSTSLVTGGAGFIGSHIAQALLGLGGKVRVLDNLVGGFESNIPEGADFVRASVLDDPALNSAARGCSYIFHEAAMVSVPQSVERPSECLEVNIRGTHRVLEAARAAGVRRVLFAASAAAYGNTPRLPSREDHPPDCWSPYASSKVAGELMLAAYARSYGLSTVSLRYFNIFGPRQDPKSAYAAVISAFLDALLAGRQPMIFGDGQQTRDFTPIENVVHANLLAASSDRPLAGEVFNIGCGGRVSLLQALEQIARSLGVSAVPKHGPVRAGDVRHSQADISRAREVLGYTPVVNFEAGMAGTAAWARSVSPASGGDGRKPRG